MTNRMTPFVGVGGDVAGGASSADGVSFDDTGNTYVTGDDVQAALDAAEASIDGLASAGVADGDKGDITVSGSGSTWTIDDDVVDNAKAADMAEATIKGRADGAGTGDPTDLTAAQVRTIINVEDGADVTDATNVAAAGAVMEADTSTASMAFVIDEDDMASDSATKVPTQQSVKAYVDAEIASVGGGVTSYFVRKTTTESVTSDTNLQDDDELFFSSLPAGTYVLSGGISYDGATGGDIKIGWGGTATINTATSQMSIGLTTATAGSTGDVTMQGDMAWGDTPSFGAAGSGRQLIIIHGYLIVTVEGSFKFRWAQSASSGTATRVADRSFIAARKVA
jgi:hypothetical protein